MLKPETRLARANLFGLAANHLEMRQEEMTDAERKNLDYVLVLLRSAEILWRNGT